MFSPMDFHSEMSRFRRQMNQVFRDFDRSFPLANDPFFTWNQPLLQDFDRSMQLDPASANVGTEQKESGEQKYSNAPTSTAAPTTTGPTTANNQMAVEPTTNQTASGTTTAHGSELQQSSNTVQPWSWGTPSSLIPSFKSISMPRVDIVENTDNFLVNCDLPGMAKDDVKVSVSADGMLSISAERSEQHEQKDEKAKYHRIERSYGKFKRSLQLPNNVDAEAVKAKHENGLLQITLPKKPKQENKQTKHILIQ